MIKKIKGLKIIIIIVSLLIFFFLSIGIFFYLSSAVDKNGKNIIFTVDVGETYNSISTKLKSSKLIRSRVIYKIYLKFAEPSNLEAGNYKLSQNMNLKELIETLKKGASNDRETITITFIEGKNMRYIINKITENFNISEEEILNILKNNDYLSELANNHWIINTEIKDTKIYYSLEGYLYPDTYEFYKDANINEIFEKMINNLERKLTPYKEEIESSGYSFHKILTLASIIEQEAGNSNDRKGVAGVFYNRLKSGWSLGSDVTTYYAEKKEFVDNLYASEIKNCNSYNTRASCMAGILPIGPICNPSIDSLIASIEPTSHDYYYFVADLYGQTYFNKTSSGHTKTVSKLKSEGKWYQY